VKHRFGNIQTTLDFGTEMRLFKIPCFSQEEKRDRLVLQQYLLYWLAGRWEPEHSVGSVQWLAFGGNN